MKDMGYTDTFIRAAADCPATRGEIPVARGDRKPVHLLQYELLAGHPYRFTHADLLFEVHVRHKAIPDEERAARAGEIRAGLLARPHPCLRASMLPKKYGWGLHFDALGRIALYSVDSEDYRRLARPGRGTQVVDALRNRRGSGGVGDQGQQGDLGPAE